MIVLDPIEIDDSVLVSTNVANEYDTYTSNGVWAAGDRVIYPDAGGDNVYQQLQGISSTVTISIASPAVVSWPGHTLTAGKAVRLNTTGALPSAFTAGATYYVVNPLSGTFQLAATVGGAAINTTGGSQSGVHTARSNDLDKAPPDEPLYWSLIGASNAYKMFDDENNTQTENADSIQVVLAAGQIINALYLGGLDANEVVRTFTDPVDGLVYTNTTSLILPTTGLSYWNWCFSRIRRRNFLIDLDLPPYVDGSLAVSINKPGSVAKCGMLAIGPTSQLGFSMYGASREDKDYSSTRFAVDGKSTTTLRPYAKKLSIDTQILNVDVDVVVEEMSNQYRQRNVVWIGSHLYGHLVVFGRYVSFKNVIADVPTSRMALNIEGVI